MGKNSQKITVGKNSQIITIGSRRIGTRIGWECLCLCQETGLVMNDRMSDQGGISVWNVKTPRGATIY